MTSGVQVLGPDGPALDLVVGEGSARALVWPGAGARLRSMHRVSLGRGARTRAQSHPHEAVYYVISGRGAVGGHALEEGAMVHVAPEVAYSFEASDEGLELIGGPSPADASLYGAAPAEGEDGGGPDGIRLFHRDRPDVLMPMIASDARLVVWVGAGARDANMNYVSMQPGEENVPHTHQESEDTIYILSGCGTVEDLTHGFELEFEAGQAIQVPPGVEHRVKANRDSAVVSVGGPCPSDVRMLKAIGALPDDFS
ncbi:MAG: cupin domain-containing protein [Myxococcaceae bacterium]